MSYKKSWGGQSAARERAGSCGAGVRALRDHPTLGFLYSYFERVRRRDMNAWDISVTMVHSSSNAEAFRPHYDRTLTDHMHQTASIGGLKARFTHPVPRCRGLALVFVNDYMHRRSSRFYAA